MKTLTKILFCSLVLVIMIGLSGCYYQAETDGEEGEQVSYIGEDIGEVELDDEEEEEVDDDEDEVEEVDDEEEEEVDDDEEEDVVVDTPAPPASSSSAITVYEGELVQLQVKGSDPDGDPVEYTFSAPLNANGKWQTEEGDAGDYLVTVTASDGKTKSSKTLKISIIQRNAPPVLEDIADITLKEGETVSLSPRVSDADGDEVTISYSGWMTKSSKTTGYEDSGNYKVTITASDGKAQAKQDVSITVVDVNRAPEFEIVVS